MRGSLPDWIVNAATEVGQRLDAESVVVFGSYANETQTRRSDLDLFVVQKTSLRPLDRIGAALAALPLMPCAVDVVVYTPEEMSSVESNFVSRVQRTGIVVYERR